MQDQAQLLDNASSDTLTWRDGQPYSTRFEDVYFSTNPDNPQQGIAETDYVFVRHNQLTQRWGNLDNNSFVIAETGFGTGLNFLCACNHWLSAAPPNTRLHFISTEKYPLTLVQMQKAHAIWADLADISQAFLAQYGALTDGTHRFTLFSGRVLLTLHIGDIQSTLPNIHTQVDAWFLDGFAPAKNPEMWQPELFAHMARLSHAETTFATFTSAGLVRRELLAHGFTVHKAEGFGRKREMLYGQFSGQVPRNHVSQPTTTIVIGGGIAGCTTAYALAMRGVQVTLLERHATIAQEASGNPKGVLYPRLAGHANAADTLALNSYLYTLRLLAQLQLPTEFFNACGVLQLAFNARERARIDAITTRALGDALVRFVEIEEASQLAGLPLFHAGLYFPQAGWINPQAFCQALTQQPNIRLETNTNVRSLTYQQHQWEVSSEQGTVFHADCVVITNANDALELSASSHLPITAVRGQMTTVSANTQSNQLNTVLCTDGYITPSSNGLHCLGATFAKEDTSVDIREKDNQQNIAMVKQMSPSLEGLEAHTATGRAALRCSTPDYLPLVGQLIHANQLTQNPPKHKTHPNALPWHHRLYVNIGHGTKGLTSAPLCAELLASIIVGDPLPLEVSLAQQLNPNRFLLKTLGLKRLVNLTVSGKL